MSYNRCSCVKLAESPILRNLQRITVACPWLHCIPSNAT